MPFEKNTDRIVMTGLRVSARIGINPGEQGIEQPVVLDIELGMADLAQAARSESIGDTLNYEEVAALARNTVVVRHYPLVETLAYQLAERLLTLRSVRSARVRVQKELAIADAKGAGAEVVLHADDVLELPAALSREELNFEESIVVVGGGVGGLSALLWCHRLGHPALLLEGESRLGGQLHWVHRPMPDLPGTSPITGHVFYHRLGWQMMRYPARWARAQVIEVEPEERSVRLVFSDGGSIRASVVVLATGVRRKQLGVPGELEFIGKGILETASRKGMSFGGQRVVVVGGGDSACENALGMAETAEQVMLICRGEKLKARREYMRGVLSHPRISVNVGAEVQGFEGDERLRFVDIHSREGARRLSADVVLVRIGWSPASEAFPRRWLDGRGFVRTERGLFVAGETRCLAVGDIRAPAAPSVVTAMGDGACAAKQAMEFLESTG